MTKPKSGPALKARAHSPMQGKLLGEVGDTVRAVHFKVGPSGFDDNETVPPGTLGTITHIDDTGSRAVKWDNGSTISLLLHEDEWEVIA